MLLAKAGRRPIELSDKFSFRPFSYAAFYLRSGPFDGSGVIPATHLNHIIIRIWASALARDQYADKATPVAQISCLQTSGANALSFGPVRIAITLIRGGQ
jgi:hypothetical protein